MVQPNRYRPFNGLLQGCLLLTLLSLCGCKTLLFGTAHLMGMGEKGEKKVQAEYDGLKEQSLTILVSVPDNIAFYHPSLVTDLSRAVSERLPNEVEKLQTTASAQALQFQKQNLYWHVSPPSDLLKTLKTSHLMIIDLSEFRLNEPGNRHIWRGTISGNMAIYRADQPSPNNPAYLQRLSVSYPPSKQHGLTKANPKALELTTIDLFSQAISNKLHDHIAPNN